MYSKEEYYEKKRVVSKETVRFTVFAKKDLRRQKELKIGRQRHSIRQKTLTFHLKTHIYIYRKSNRS